MPLALARKSHAITTEKSKELDKELLEGLARVGFRLDFGEDNTGWQFKYLTRGGGYYFNVGCSDLVVRGEIGLQQFSDIESFIAEGVKMKRGETLAADLIVLATGYKPQEHLVRRLFGEEVAARVGPIWGFGDGQELRNMYTRTGQPGLWFIAGSLAQCRINSKYLALQIKAIEEGLLPRDVRGGTLTRRPRLSFGPEVGRLDDRPPPFHLVFLKGPQGFRRLVVARRYLNTEIRKPPLDLGIGEHLSQRGIELFHNLLRRILRHPQPVPERGNKSG